MKRKKQNKKKKHHSDHIAVFAFCWCCCWAAPVCEWTQWAIEFSVRSVISISSTRLLLVGMSVRACRQYRHEATGFIAHCQRESTNMCNALARIAHTHTHCHRVVNKRRNEILYLNVGYHLLGPQCSGEKISTKNEKEYGRIRCHRFFIYYLLYCGPYAIGGCDIIIISFIIRLLTELQ